MDKRPVIDLEAVREQVGRILRSPEFAASPRLGEFLTFVTEVHLSGRGDTIKEYVIGLEVYRKRDGYDPRIDPTVRVDAGKLRVRLGKYYQNGGSSDPIRIEIPKGSYIPRFEWVTPQLGSPVVPRWRPSRWLLASGIVLIALAGAVLVAWRPHESPPPMLRTISLASISGEQYDPSLSPDGSMLAFSWNGEQRDNFDIYVKVTDAPHSVRLTTNPAPDMAPRWSPDGQRIAFIRNPGPGGQVIVIPALGGDEHVVGLTEGKWVYWTADGGSLLVSRRPAAGRPWAGYIISLESGASRQITFPPEDAESGDYDLIPSPDGLKVAFSRMVHPPQAEIRVLELRSGKSRPLLRSDTFLDGLAWTPSGRDIVFSSRKSGMHSLWIMAATGGEPAPFGGTALNATRPSVAPRSLGLDRIAYERVQRSANLFSLDLNSAASAQKIAGSDHVTMMAQFSPDEKRIAFGSDRSGHFSVWVARADGTEAREITAGQQILAGAPRWSPDGTQIAFDAHGSGGESSDIYVVDANGYVSPRRLSPPADDRVRPAWSADGHWIYFSSSQSGARQIWRMPAGGGAAMQMTRNGGFDCFESPEGRDLCFTKGLSAVGLWRIPVAGGPEEAICPLVRQAHWGLTAHGIAFQDMDQPVSILDLPSGRVARFAPAGQRDDVRFGFTITGDGRRAIYAQSETASSELIMLEGRLFR